MSRSVRSRPIQPARKMRIFREGNPLFLHVSFNAHYPDADEPTSLGAKPKEKPTSTTATLQNQKKGVVVEIPVPPILPVSDYKHEVPANFHQPKPFIRYREPKENSGEISGFKDLQTAPPVELNLSLQDMNWLKSHHKYGENGDPRFRISNNLFERMLYLLELHCGNEDRIITVKEAEDIFVQKLKLYRPSAAEKKLMSPHAMHTTNAVSTVYKYWMASRNRLAKPILRRFWPPTSIEDQNPHMVFRPREKERYRLRKNRRNDSDALLKSQLLKKNFDRVKLIMKYVRKREHVKRHLLTIRKELFLQKLNQILHPLTSSSRSQRSTNSSSAKSRPTIINELNQDLQYILNDGGHSTGNDLDSARRVGSYYEQDEDEEDEEDGNGGNNNNNNNNNKRSRKKRSAANNRSSSNKKRRLGNSSDDSIGTMLPMLSRQRQRQQSAQSQDEYDSTVSRIDGLAGQLLRHIDQHGQRRSIAAAVFGIGDLLSESDTNQILSQGSSKSSSNLSSSSSTPSSHRFSFSKTDINGRDHRVSFGGTSTNTGSPFKKRGRGASTLGQEGHLAINAPHTPMNSGIPMVSPVQRRRQRLASVSRASNTIKHQKEKSFARTADDKIYSERLEDLSTFVPSFMLDIESNPLHPSMVNEQLKNLPERVATDGTNIPAPMDDVMAWSQQQNSTWNPIKSTINMHQSYPPERWNIQEGDAENENENDNEDEEKSGNRRRTNNTTNTTNTTNSTNSTNGITKLGSRGLWQRRAPPIRYHARGRIGRNDRIWMDRIINIDLEKQEKNVKNSIDGSKYHHMLHYRHGGRSSGGKGGMREAIEARDITSQIMERKYAYGLFNRRTKTIETSHTLHSTNTNNEWSDQQSYSNNTTSNFDFETPIVPGTLSGARRHIYATPHPLESGNTFYDVARTVTEQIPTLTSTLKHLIPSVFMTCEEITSAQPMVSAASSAAGSAKTGVTYNSQKREPRIFQQPGGGGVVEDAFLLTGAPLTQRLNDIYSMSDDEDDMIESISDVNSSGIDISSSKILYHPENGQQLYGNVKQVKMQLGL